jgi:hypothetical protein
MTTHYILLLVTVYAVCGCLLRCAFVYFSPIDRFQ